MAPGEGRKFPSKLGQFLSTRPLSVLVTTPPVTIPR